MILVWLWLLMFFSWFWFGYDCSWSSVILLRCWSFLPWPCLGYDRWLLFFASPLVLLTNPALRPPQRGVGGTRALAHSIRFQRYQNVSNRCNSERHEWCNGQYTTQTNKKIQKGTTHKSAWCIMTLHRRNLHSSKEYRVHYVATLLMHMATLLRSFVAKRIRGQGQGIHRTKQDAYIPLASPHNMPARKPGNPQRAP